MLCALPGRDHSLACGVGDGKKAERMPWSNDEKRAVERQLGSNIRLGIVPRKAECEACKACEPALSKRTWQNIKFHVHTAILRNRSIMNRV
jgi:hypothetical protein